MSSADAMVVVALPSVIIWGFSIEPIISLKQQCAKAMGDYLERRDDELAMHVASERGEKITFSKKNER